MRVGSAGSNTVQEARQPRLWLKRCMCERGPRKQWLLTLIINLGAVNHKESFLTGMFLSKVKKRKLEKT